MEVEWLILADAAQVVGGKLYLLGGGWSALTVNGAFPVQQRCGVAASFVVPWNETNQPQNAEIEIATEDGQSLARIEGKIEVGRPPGIRPGQSQRVQLAADLGLTIEGPGTYVVIARVEGREGRRIDFTVTAGPPPQR
jgi:hypothetical protein